MGRKQIIRMAREACDADKVDAWYGGFWTLTQEELERFAALVAAAERDACAKLADGQIERWVDDRARYAASECAAAIRARSTP